MTGDIYNAYPYTDPEDLYQTIERLGVMTGKTRRLRDLQTLTDRLKKTEISGLDLQIQIDSLYRSLTRISSDLEKVSQTRPEDPDIWSETADLIDILDKMTRDIRVSLSDYLKTLDQKTPEIMILINKTADHYIEDLETPISHYPETEDLEKVT